jgi:hypothetical protein
MGYERGGRPILPDLDLPPDPDKALPDLGRSSGAATRHSSDYPPPGLPPRVHPPVRSRDEDRPLPPLLQGILLSSPYGAIAIVALLPAGLLDIIPIESIPISLLLMVLSQGAGWWVGRSSGAEPISRMCQMNVGILTIVLPFLALQTSAVRVPYVSSELGTATPAIIATIAAVAALVGAAALAVALTWDGPDSAALLFTPVALFVPELLGTPLNPSVGEIVDRIFEVFALMVVLTIAVTFLPQVAKLIAPSVMLALLFLGLWVVGRGPTWPASSGDIVRVLDGSLLVMAVILLVAVPILAIGARRVVLEVRGPGI